MELLARPLTTKLITGPLLAPAGTGAIMLVLLQLTGVAAAPLKLVTLVPCVSAKLVAAQRDGSSLHDG
jgi:hypothetical protein